MYDALDRAHLPSSLAAPASLCDGTPETSPSTPPSHAASGLLRWLIPTHILRRSAADPEPLDAHTLSDIGLSQIDMLYTGPKK